MQEPIEQTIAALFVLSCCSLAAWRLLRFWPRREETFAFDRLPSPAVVLLIGSWLIIPNAVAFVWLGSVQNVFEFAPHDVDDWDVLRAKVLRGRDGPSQRLRELLRQSRDGESLEDLQHSDLRDELNDLLPRPDLFRDDAFSAVPIADDVRERFSAGIGDLSEVQIVRMNRLLLEYSYPDLVRSSFRTLFVAALVGKGVALVFLLAGCWLLTGLATVGWNKGNVRWPIAYGVAQTLVWTPPTYLVSTLMRLVSSQKTENIAQLFFMGSHGWVDWLLLAVTVSFAAPVMEEFVFRGLLQRWLRGALGAIPALCASALLFGFAHAGSWPDPVPLIILGLGLGLVMERTGSLWPCIALHAAFNSVPVLAGLFFT